MDKKEMLAFINQNPIASLATTEGTAARVRGMDTFRADEDGLVFYTGKKKDVFKQLSANPEVEVCYMAEGTQVRVRGKMEILEDEALKMEIVEKRPFLKQIYQGNFEGMGVCRLRGKATSWSMKDMAAPVTYIDF